MNIGEVMKLKLNEDYTDFVMKPSQIEKDTGSWCKRCTETSINKL